MTKQQICIFGAFLWANTCGINFTYKNYEKYVNHIINCKTCRKSLKINEKGLSILKEFFENKNDKN